MQQSATDGQTRALRILQHALHCRCCNSDMAMVHTELHYFTVVDDVPTLCFSMTLPLPPCDVKYNTCGICKCRSPTNSMDTSSRIGHNCSCGKKWCRRSGDITRQLGLCEPRVPKYVSCWTVWGCVAVWKWLNQCTVPLYACLKYSIIYTGSAKKMYTHFNERKLYVV